VSASVKEPGAAGNRPANPYVGPRAFRAGEAFFGRDREQRDLANLLIAERVVLLHAPSGAGKTSLIQAGLIPRLKKRHFHPTPAARVKTPPDDGVQVHNRYIYSVALDLLDSDRDPKELAGLRFADIIRELTPPAEEGYLVLILDQFEELLSIDPTDWENQTVFFEELGAALQDGHLWALISMREDYMGGLDRFLRYMPGHLRTTYRLDFLDRAAAKVAIQRPARERGVEFADDAAADLVAKLGKVLVARACKAPAEIDAPYVQPFQLQVVCHRLWTLVAQMRRSDFRSIELQDVHDYAHVLQALADYYAGAMADVARRTGVEEIAIRRWFERELITSDGLRTQTLAGPESGQHDTSEVLRELQDTYLVRSDTRAGSTWYELSHDTLVSAVLDDNRKWLRGRLQPWQLAARAWAEDQERARLLTGSDLRAAQRQEGSPDLTEDERNFLKESERVEKDRGALARMRGAMTGLSLVVIVETALIVVLLVLLFAR
jgi:Novel STAND NTPase 1